MAKTTLTGPNAGYETTFITRGEMTDDALKALQAKLDAVVAEYKGEIVLHEDWGSKKMAYKIQKESRGRYTHMVYTGQGNIVAEMERNLRLNEFVMRFLSVNIADEFEREAFMKRKEEVKAAAKKREEEREARREEREARRGNFHKPEAEESFDEPSSEASEE